MFFKVECSFRVYGPEVYCRPILAGICNGKVYWEEMDIDAVKKLESHHDLEMKEELKKGKKIFTSDK